MFEPTTVLGLSFCSTESLSSVVNIILVQLGYAEVCQYIKSFCYFLLSIKCKRNDSKYIYFDFIDMLGFQVAFVVQELVTLH